MNDYKEWWCEKFEEIKEENPNLTEDKIARMVECSFGDLVDSIHEAYKN